jgi:hypothetical protein
MRHAEITLSYGLISQSLGDDRQPASRSTVKKVHSNNLKDVSALSK